MKFTKKYIIALALATTILVIYSFTDQSQAVPEPQNDTLVLAPITHVEAASEVDPNYQISSPQIPDHIVFAGEKVPLDRSDVREKLDREILVNTYWQSSTILLLKRSQRLFKIIEPILKENGVPDDFKYLAVAESGLIENAVSSSGARGIWQFMKTTGRKYGLESTITVEERYNTRLATKAACTYLKRAYKNTGSWALAAAAYNRGVSGILRDMKKQNVKSYYDMYLNRETGRYLYRIIALKTIMQTPANYGFNISPDEAYKSINSYTVSVDTTILNLPSFAQNHGTNYLILRTLNPWLVGYTLQNKSHKKYQILLPYLKAEGFEE
jgi:membrane-bound lytic murein transglycosylase D